MKLMISGRCWTGSWTEDTFITMKSLRQLVYLIDSTKKKEEININVTSKLHFIEIHANISLKINENHAYEWFQKLANNLEILVHVDETIFPYVLLYLDEKIKIEPNQKEIEELHNLLHACISLPTSTEKALESFSKEWNNIFPFLTLVDYSDYQKLIEFCLDNETKNLIALYDEIKNHLDLALFLSIITEILSLPGKTG